MGVMFPCIDIATALFSSKVQLWRGNVGANQCSKVQLWRGFAGVNPLPAEVSRENNNNIIKTYRLCENCIIKFQLSKAISEDYSNPLNNFCETCYVELIQNNNLPEDNTHFLNKQKREKSINLIKRFSNNNEDVNFNSTKNDQIIHPIDNRTNVNIDDFPSSHSNKNEQGINSSHNRLKRLKKVLTYLKKINSITS